MARPLGRVAVSLARLAAILLTVFACMPCALGRRSVLSLRLRATGFQDLAPELFVQGVRCVQDILPCAAALLMRGVPSWKLQAIVRGRLETTVALPPGRPDHPAAQSRSRASWPTALEAAQPQNRAAALAELKAAILAATARPSLDSRLKWRELPPWPLTVTLIHSVGASLKRVGYHSCSSLLLAVLRSSHRASIADPWPAHWGGDQVRRYGHSSSSD